MEMRLSVQNSQLSRGVIVPDISAYSNYSTVPPVHIAESKLSVKGSFSLDLGSAEKFFSLESPVEDQLTELKLPAGGGVLVMGISDPFSLKIEKLARRGSKV